MNMTLSDELLQKLTCRKCQNCLSMAPIYMDKNGDGICGRCVSLENANTVIRNKTYETLASSIRFPCINSKGGCKEQINFDEMQKHENICCYKTWKCPSSTNCVWVGTKGKFLAHYKVTHKNLILSQQEFKIKLNEDINERCVFVVENDAYLIHKKFVEKTGLFETSLEFLEQTEETATFDVHIKINDTTVTFNNNKLLSYTEEPQKQITIDINALMRSMKMSGTTDAIICKITIEYPDEFLFCTFCKIRLTSPVYRCPDNHVSCLDCISDFGNICKDCGRSGITFTKGNGPKHPTFSCRWKGCNMKNIPSEFIRKHDRECTHRRYECFDCSQQIGLKNDYFKHLREKFGNVRIGNSFNISPHDRSDRYLISHNEIFWLRCVKGNFKIICFGPPFFKKKVEYYVHPNNLKLKGACVDIEKVVEDQTVLISVAD